jgi:hypothetical protein
MCGNGSRDELQDLQAESNGKFGAMDVELGTVSLRSWVVEGLKPVLFDLRIHDTCDMNGIDSK